MFTTKRLLSAAAGLLAAAVVVSLAVPTSAAYKTPPVAAAMEAASTVAVDLPRTVVPGKKVFDAAHDPRSGRTFMLASDNGARPSSNMFIQATELPGWGIA